MTSRDALVEAAKAILWDRGYEAMSPRIVLEKSGVGHGSFYHHFKRKEDLALAALDSVCEELLNSAVAILCGTGSALDRIKAFLKLKRKTMMGCRLGRLVNESSVMSSSLKKPIRKYFTGLKRVLLKVIGEAVEAGELPGNLDSEALAELVIASVQGGYVLSRGQNDRAGLEKAVSATCTFLNLLNAQAKST